MRRASECALLGALWFIFSIPIVTAGAAWCAVAEICRDWAHGHEPPLLPTFAKAVRRNLGRGLLLEAVLAVLVGLAYFESRVTVLAGLPAAGAERIALTALSACAVALALLSVEAQADCRRSWLSLVPQLANVVLQRPWVVPASIGSLGAAAALVYLMPPLAVFMAGPAGYAMSAIYQRLDVQ